MNIDRFVEQFAELYENAEGLTSQTKFKEHPEWNSLLALGVIALVDEEYDVALKGQDVQNSTTIEDVFKAVQAKL